MQSQFEQFNLSPAVLRGVAKLGFTAPTPVQAAAIPLLLAGRDAIVQAKTGSGKTLAFGLPMLTLLKRESRPQALVILPTRELAIQVCEAITSVAVDSPLRILPVYGGVSLGPQESALRRGVDIIVGTPGRLKDLLSRGSLDLGAVRILVLDEADQMLDMGFRPDMTFLIDRLPKREQTLIFSATMPPEIETIARKYLKDPAVEKLAGQDVIPSEIEHHFVRVNNDTRLSVLLHLLKEEKPETAIIFTRMKHETKRLAKKLEDHAGISAGYLNGNMSQNARNTMLARFREGDISVLVATDVAARGLDIEGLSHVFHYAVPTVVETYIHRSGRTGRAGNSGKTYTLVPPDGEGDFKAIQKKIKFVELQLNDMVRVEDTPAPPPPPRQGRGQRPQQAPRTNATPQGQAPSRHLAAPQGRDGRNDGRQEGRNEAPRGRRPVNDTPAASPSNSAWRKFKMALAPGHRHNDEGFQGWLADYVGVKRSTIRAVRVGNDHATFELEGIAAERFLVKVNERNTSAPRPANRR